MTDRLPLLVARVGRCVLALVFLVTTQAAAQNSATLESAPVWTLHAAIEAAVADNPDVRAAQYTAAAASARVGQADAAFMPRLSLRSSYVRTDNPVTVFSHVLNQGRFSFDFDVNDPPQADNLNVAGVVSLPLYSGGANVAGLAGAQADAEVARYAADAVRAAIVLEVARSFYGLIESRGLVRAVESAAEAMEANLTLATKRYEVGTLLKAEVLDVRVRLAEAREDIVGAHNAVASAEHRLHELLGLEGGSAAFADAAPMLEVPTGDDFESRAELAAARYRVEQAEAAVRVAGAGRLPQVSTFGSYDYDQGWEFDGNGSSWTAGVAMQWNLWDGDLTRARVDEASAALAAAKQARRKARLAVAREVAQARLDLATAAARVEVTEVMIEQAAQSAELMRARFAEGLTLAVQLLDAETSLTGARVRHTRAVAARNVAVAALRYALGLSQSAGSEHGS